jgi:ribonucleoside-diphosphate reductase alpha chain
MNELHSIHDNKTETIKEGANLVNARKETLENHKAKTESGFEWLTEHSRNFLDSGYLTDGVTAEHRIREIADRAEHFENAWFFR